MTYSTATFQAVSVLLLIYFKSESGCMDYLSTRTISEMLNIPAPTVVSVLNRLRDAGLISTKEGSKGGISLSRPSSEITFLDVFNAMEKEKPLFKTHPDINVNDKCHDLIKDNVNDECLDLIKEKAVRCLRDAESSMKDSLDSVTLLDLLT
jgi:Rrf2 family protein